MELGHDQMGTCLFLLKNPVSWVVVLAPLITSASFFIFGSLSIFFTSTVLILSTVVFILSKRKLKLVVESVEEDIHKSVEESSPQIQPEGELNKQNSKDQEGASYDHQIHDCIAKSPDVLSEKECVNDDQLPTTEDSEVDWSFRDNRDGTPDWSDDEDSLIEISLPGGQYQPNNKYGSMQQKLPEFMPESIFQQRSLMELLAELNDMNEEENLIEIDISMGSIKYSRFEIEA
ncbi:hypothetical protein ERO13_D07G198400v2 [Gossypium hirsutum]|uniref:Transmembrane protein n=1 Tax=Gossypium hirsutum TaxID=3635 RepID=A0A1U8P4L2_GOSHI|nr:uncharacterized protein LOC107954975 [Gossypium hirsutum]KAG4139517.1 hypothetical protein ERO13_D07G198400v2 [Gossypium hirsutum]